MVKEWLKLPIEEDIFYDVNGYEVSRTNLVQQMIQYYDEKLSIGETRVTDFNEGSEIRNLLEAIAVDVYNLMEDRQLLTEIAFVETANGEWLDKHGANPFIQLSRNDGVEATGFVTFSIPEVTTSDVVIPVGTIVVSTDNSLQYETDSDLIIAVGETEITGSATCLTVGVDGNCAEDTITLIEDETIGVNGLTVNNNEAFTGGLDYEEDEIYRQRLLDYLRKDDFGSVTYYENLCNEVEGVHDVSFVDVTGYTKKCLVNGYTKPTPNTVLADVLEQLTIPDNIVLGHSFTVDKPTYTTHNFTINLGVTVEQDEDFLNDLLSSLFNGVGLTGEANYDGLSIGETLTKERFYNAFLLYDEIETIEVLESNVEISDLTVNSNAVLKLGTITWEQTVIES